MFFNIKKGYNGYFEHVKIIVNDGEYEQDYTCGKDEKTGYACTVAFDNRTLTNGSNNFLSGGKNIQRKLISVFNVNDFVISLPPNIQNNDIVKITVIGEDNDGNSSDPADYTFKFDESKRISYAVIDDLEYITNNKRKALFVGLSYSIYDDLHPLIDPRITTKYFRGSVASSEFMINERIKELCYSIYITKKGGTRTSFVVDKKQVLAVPIPIIDIDQNIDDSYYSTLRESDKTEDCVYPIKEFLDPWLIYEEIPILEEEDEIEFSVYAVDLTDVKTPIKSIKYKCYIDNPDPNYDLDINGMGYLHLNGGNKNIHPSSSVPTKDGLMLSVSPSDPNMKFYVCTSYSYNSFSSHVDKKTLYAYKQPYVFSFQNSKKALFHVDPTKYQVPNYRGENETMGAYGYAIFLKDNTIKDFLNDRSILCYYPYFGGSLKINDAASKTFVRILPPGYEKENPYSSNTNISNYFFILDLKSAKKENNLYYNFNNIGIIKTAFDSPQVVFPIQDKFQYDKISYHDVDMKSMSFDSSEKTGWLYDDAIRKVTINIYNGVGPNSDGSGGYYASLTSYQKSTIPRSPDFSGVFKLKKTVTKEMSKTVSYSDYKKLIEYMWTGVYDNSTDTWYDPATGKPMDYSVLDGLTWNYWFQMFYKIDIYPDLKNSIEKDKMTIIEFACETVNGIKPPPFSIYTEYIDDFQLTSMGFTDTYNTYMNWFYYGSSYQPENDIKKYIITNSILTKDKL